jgi:nicotinate-nucleotide adenylyltransferase
MGERLGVFGGTFDPPHVGHLVVAVNVRHALGLDRVLLVVANDPWQKTSGRDVSAAADRLAMVEAAVGDVDGLEASAVEIERGGVSYTADTLAALRADDPDAELFLVVGTDAARGLTTWDRVDAVRDMATLVVVTRPDGDEATEDSVEPLPGWRWAARSTTC